MTSIMGILNITPDSFSDGGQFFHLDSALKQVDKMIGEGADIIDIGGESTRPGADSISVNEELQRVIPLVEAIQQRFDIAISVDTSKALVMQEAIQANVSMINDVNALQAVNAMKVVANSNVKVCLMHMQGQPSNMQTSPCYDDVIQSVKIFFDERIQACKHAGIVEKRIILDPGFGFGKTLQHNLHLLSQLNQLLSYKRPLLIGISRKSMIGSILDGASVDQRVFGSIAAALFGVYKGAQIIRVHDVKATADAIRVWESISILEK